MILPTVLMNGAWWGQCDAFYAGFTILALAELMRGRTAWAMLAFGAALAFKVQVIFMAPVCIALLLRRRIHWAQVAMPILAFAAWMVPAWLAGRPAWSLATIYLNQGSFYHQLSKSAPNPWEYIEFFHLLSYQNGVLLGSMLALICTLALAFLGYRWLRLDRHDLLVLATASALVLPFVLPKMHNRYFFLADVFSYMLAVVEPSRARKELAICMQCGSGLAYAQYLFHLPGTAALGALFVARAIYLMAGELRATMAATERIGAGSGDRTRITSLEG
jgi:Gpi18-like mannosyltransferase